VTSAVEQIERGGAVRRLGESLWVARHHLVRVGRRRICLGAEDRNATKAAPKKPNEQRAARIGPP
jgi:hypothetical protein